MEQQQQDARIGLIAIVAAVFLGPLVIALWLALLGIMATAWHWMIAAFQG